MQQSAGRHRDQVRLQKNIRKCQEIRHGQGDMTPASKCFELPVCRAAEPPAFIRDYDVTGRAILIQRHVHARGRMVLPRRADILFMKQL